MRFHLLLILCLGLAGPGIPANAQLNRLNEFEIKQQDVVWEHVYEYQGTTDSLRIAVVEMLKSKFYTFNVVRNPDGYHGEIHHYKVDCKRYGRTYRHTPRMYWDGEWKGKFMLDLHDGYYHVVIYGLYFEHKEQVIKQTTTEKVVKGRYFDAITNRDKSSFKKKEQANVLLMSLSLKDSFDIKNTVSVKN